MQFLQMFESVLQVKLINFYIVLFWCLILLQLHQWTVWHLGMLQAGVLFFITSKKLLLYPWNIQITDKNVRNAHIKKYGWISGMAFEQIQVCLKVSYCNYIYLSTNSSTELDFFFFGSYAFSHAQKFSLKWKVLLSDLWDGQTMYAFKLHKVV